MKHIKKKAKLPNKKGVGNIVADGSDVDSENESKTKGYYFDNNKVEALLTEYVKGGCTDVKLRNEIMSHAMELLRQIIRTHNFHNIYPGRDAASFGDLFQVGWVQIEKTLYKFDYRPGHTKVFNMWSQIAKTVILAHIKREMRDKKNYGTYKGHLGSRYRHHSDGFALQRFLSEAREMSKFDNDGLAIINALEKLYEEDERPYDGLIGKLVKLSGLSRQKVTSFLRQIRLRSFEFTDSPLNQEQHQIPKPARQDYENDD
ncbi:MAG: hypothetical protein QXU32_00725 [Nitrososphaerales archaeon]